MTTTPSSDNELSRWERELLADHRWGRMKKWFPNRPELWEEERAAREHARLRELWSRAQPLDKSCEETLNAVMALEICNWNLEQSILGLCRAIGTKQPPHLRIGHGYSIAHAPV